MGWHYTHTLTLTLGKSAQSTCKIISEHCVFCAVINLVFSLDSISILILFAYARTRFISFTSVTHQNRKNEETKKWASERLVCNMCPDKTLQCLPPFHSLISFRLHDLAAARNLFPMKRKIALLYVQESNNPKSKNAGHLFQQHHRILHTTCHTIAIELRMRPEFGFPNESPHTNILHLSVYYVNHWLCDVSATRVLNSERYSGTDTLLSNGEHGLLHALRIHIRRLIIIIIIIRWIIRSLYNSLSLLFLAAPERGIRQCSETTRKREQEKTLRFHLMFLHWFCVLRGCFQRVKTISANACENNTQNTFAHTFAEWQ